MKQNVEIEAISYKKDDQLHIVFKLDFLKILKKILKKNDVKETEILLSVINDIPVNKKNDKPSINTEVKPNDITDIIIKKNVNQLEKNRASDCFSHTYTITLRSSVICISNKYIDILSLRSKDVEDKGIVRGDETSQGGIPKKIFSLIKKFKNENEIKKVNANELAYSFSKWIRKLGYRCKDEYFIKNEKFKRNSRVDIAVFKNNKLYVIIEVKNYKTKSRYLKSLNNQSKQIQKYSEFGVPILFLSSVRQVESILRSFINFTKTGVADKNFIYKPVGIKTMKQDLSYHQEVDEDSFQMSKKVKQLLDADEKKFKNNGFSKKINDWNALTFSKYIAMKFKGAYGVGSFEFNRTVNVREAEGKVRAMISNVLVKGFKKNGLDNSGVRKYIDWIYDVKSNSVKTPITIHLLCSSSMITEWMVVSSGKTKNFSKQNEGIGALK